MSAVSLEEGVVAALPRLQPDSVDAALEAASASVGGAVEPPPPLPLSGTPLAAADEDAIDVAEGFEGPEKTLEIDLIRGVGADRGMREIGDERWAALLAKAQCQILSRMSNEHIDAYVLSESSLFVFSHKVVLKTCGTTTLLRCVPMLLEFVRELGLEVEWFNYSRKNFTYPHRQLSPHTGFDAEVSYLARHFAEGDAFVLGPLTADHWFVFDHDATKPGAMQRSMERTLDLMMFDIGEPLARAFYKEDRGHKHAGGQGDGDGDGSATKEAEAKAATDLAHSTGIASLFPGAKLDATLFDPCGYSLNGLLFDSYFTIHVTPEPQCSYASFETTTCLRSYSSLIKNVLQIFKPKRFVMTLFVDDGAKNDIRDDPFTRTLLEVPGHGAYRMKGHSATHFEAGHSCEMGNWVLDQGAVSPCDRVRKQTMD